MKKFTFFGIFLTALFTFLQFSTIIAASPSSIQNECLIWADIEPDKTDQGFSAVQVLEIDSQLSPWTNLSGGNISDNDMAILSLLPGQISNEIIFKSFYVDIPLGSTIHGIGLQLTGQSSNPNSVIESSIQFFLDESPISTNIAGKSNISVPWKTEITTWNYGFEYSDWGYNWNLETLQSPDLSLRIQLSNSNLNNVVEVGIDDVKVIVYYTPPYRVCSSDCVVLYNDEVDGVSEYVWDVPDGVKFLNNDPLNRAVNLDFSKAPFGLLDIELSMVVNGEEISCKRQVLHEDCGPAAIGDYIWFDENLNGFQDDYESGFADIEIALYNPFHKLIQTTQSTADGAYQFADLNPGFYYIQVNGIGIIASPFNAFDEDFDSDLKADFKTEIFYLTRGDTVTNYDFGLFDDASITGKVWRECDGNGDLDSEDIVLKDYEIEIYKNNILLGSTLTNEFGIYEFQGLFPGEYELKLNPTEPISFLNASNSPNVQNDFLLNGTFSRTLIPGEDLIDIDAAFNPKKNLQVDLFFDENENGEFEMNEALFDDSYVFLFQDNMLIDSSLVSNGVVNFNQLSGSNYDLFWIPPSDYEIKSSADFVVFKANGGYLISEFSLDCFSDNRIEILPTRLGASIGDFIWYDDNKDGLQQSTESGIEGIIIKLVDFETAELVQEVISDTNGKYLFKDVPAGQYLVFFEFDAPYSLTLFNVDEETGSKGNIFSGQEFMGPITVVNGDESLNWDTGFYIESATIGDFVWLDSNENGIQDPLEKGIPNVVIRAFDESGNQVSKTQTDVNGYYSFELAPGNYYFVFESEDYSEFTIFDASFDNTLNSDVSSFNKTGIISLLPGEENNNIDAGYKPKLGSIGNLVFLDLNENGLFDQDEIGLSNFLVEAFLEDGTFVQSTITETGGFYNLELEAGTYYLKFSKNGFDEAAPYVQNSFDKNSDISGAFGKGTTDLIVLEAYQNKEDIDAGFLTVSTIIGDYVWQDYNSNGLQDASEIGLPGMTVNLIQEGKGIVQSTKTANGFNGDRGYYSFSVSDPGNYYLQFVLPDNSFVFTQSNVSEEDIDSNVSGDNGFGTTGNIFIEPGENRTDIDAGVVGTSSIIGDFVWFDANNNGIQDLGEDGINGMNVFLYDEEFNFLNVTVTTYNQELDKNGYYEFGEIESGKYILVFDSKDDFSPPKVGSNPEIDSDVTSSFVNGSTDIIELLSASTSFNIDAGILNSEAPTTGSIGDLVWEDLNKNGIFEATEKGIQGVNIELIDENGKVVSETSSSNSGTYLFENIKAGQYRVYCELPDDYLFTIPDNSFDDLTDSDMDENGYSKFITISGGEEINHVDIGLIPSNGIIQGETWLELLKNGELDVSEMGIQGLQIDLYDIDGELVQTVHSSITGNFIFQQLTHGDYYLKFHSEDLFEYSQTNNSNVITNDFGAVTTGVLTISDQITLLDLKVPFLLNPTKASNFIDIDSYKKNDVHIIHWTSSYGKMASYFDIERKTPNGQWEWIGKKTVEDSEHFQWKDELATSFSGHIGYRVIQHNKDNQLIYSTETWILDDEDIAFTINPNPTSFNPVIRFVMEKDEKMKMYLFSADGFIFKEVLPWTQYDAGEYTRSIDISGLTSGSYFLKFVSESKNTTKKLIVNE